VFASYQGIAYQKIWKKNCIASAYMAAAAKWASFIVSQVV